MDFNHVKNQYIVCFDVYYYREYAKACCIVFKTEPEERVICQYCTKISPVNEYISGEFYKRELPCILAVLDEVKEGIGLEKISLALVDGFVLLDKGKKGLGAYLYEALKERLPVIGVAKTPYKGSESCLKIYRGQSKNPLFISSMGIDIDSAARFVMGLGGKNRIPDMLKRVDRLTRADIRK